MLGASIFNLVKIINRDFAIILLIASVLGSALGYYLSEMLLGSIERVNAIIIHLAMSLLVLNAFRKKNILWFLASILWHTLTNAVAVYSVVVWGPYVTELLLFVIALLSIGIILILQKRDPDPEEKMHVELPPPVPILSTPQEVNITTENLDDSRYD